MNFFSEEPELLGGTQTLLGVLVTLIVLCLFTNESNFLLGLIRNMVADFAKNLQEKMADIRNQIDEKKKATDSQLGGIVTNRKYWVKQAKLKDDHTYDRILQNNKEEQDILEGILNNLNGPLEKFDQTKEFLDLKRENIFVSLFFLILLICVMMIDACCVSNSVGSLFLTLLTYISAVFTFTLWRRFFIDKESGIEYHNHRYIKSYVISFNVIIVLIWFVLLGLLEFDDKGVWFFSFAYFFILVWLFSSRLMYNFRYSVRYNNQFIIKHSFYIMFLCAIITFVLFEIHNIAWLDCSNIMYPYLQNIQINIDKLVVNSKWTIRIFVIIATCNTFFLPLLLGYYYNHKKATGATRLMEENKKVILSRLDKNIKEYQDIIQDIQKG